MRPFVTKKPKRTFVPPPSKVSVPVSLYEQAPTGTPFNSFMFPEAGVITGLTVRADKIVGRPAKLILLIKNDPIETAINIELKADKPNFINDGEVAVKRGDRFMLCFGADYSMDNDNYVQGVWTSFSFVQRS